MKHYRTQIVIFLYKKLGFTLFNLKFRIHISKKENCFVCSCNDLNYIGTNNSLTNLLIDLSSKISTYIKTNDLSGIRSNLTLGFDEKNFNEAELAESKQLIDKIVKTVVDL